MRFYRGKIPKDLFSLKFKILGTIILILGISLFIWVYYSYSQSKVIILTSEGFKPRELKINKGDTITFKTTTGKPFWPASNLHPSHEIYSAFDPKKPVEPNKTWSFKFTREGAWKFHDHLAPLFKGSIVVGNPKNQQAISYDSCKKVSPGSQFGCWERALESTLQTKGISSALALFKELSIKEPTFAEHCHSFTHSLGEAAYEKFRQGEDFPVTQQVAYCSYGFFHGFIEAMMQTEKDLTKAREMCDYIDQKLKNETGTLNACLHGIGHGITDGTNSTLYGNVDAIINPGLDLCKKIGNNEFEVKLCGTGVFNALAIMYLEPKYKLNLDKNDPYAICRKQKESYFKHACYDDLKGLVFELGNSDLAQAAALVDTIEGDNYAGDAMDNLASYYVYFMLKDNDDSDDIQTCLSLSPRLQTGCITGLGAGLMTAGLPDQEYIRALDLCRSTLLNEDQQTACYGRVLGVSYSRYSQKKLQEVCSTVDEKNRQYCPS